MPVVRLRITSLPASRTRATTAVERDLARALSGVRVAHVNMGDRGAFARRLDALVGFRGRHRYAVAA